MKCQNKKKNVKRAVAGIIFLSVIAIILSAYGVTQMYASPEKKALKTMLKSGAKNNIFLIIHLVLLNIYKQHRCKCQ